MMKKWYYLLLVVFLTGYACSEPGATQKEDAQASSWDSTGKASLNFYDDAPRVELGMKPILIKGLIQEEIQVDLSTLPTAEVIVKEAYWIEEGDRFKGAYLFEGVSLFEIMNKAIISRPEGDCFDGITDLCVRVIGKTDTVVLTWGEVFYPVDRNDILIAHAVRRIVPSKTQELWELPTTTRLVVGPDLLTERNIEAPHTIEVFSPSCGPDDIMDREATLISDHIRIVLGNDTLAKIQDIPASMASVTYRTVFYGRGKGIHSTTPFTGYPLERLLEPYVQTDASLLKHGLAIVIAADGYRCAFSISELFNRREPGSVLLIPREGDGGRYSLYVPADFFSDRAIKAIKEIRIHPAI